MWPAKDPEHNDEPDGCSRRGCLFQVPGWSHLSARYISIYTFERLIIIKPWLGHVENLSFTLKTREPTFLLYIVIPGGHVKVHGGLY